MTLMLPALLALTGFASIAVIWRGWKFNRVLIADLHRRVKQADFGGEIIVSLRDPVADFDPLFSVRRARPVRVAQPKPVTHRLHQFMKPRSVA